MGGNRRIFVGSSVEAATLAEKVGAAIGEAGMTPVIWDAGAFPAGSTLLERIEHFADEFEAAVLLVTPDVFCRRRERSFYGPVSNVMFEYGYLSARLTRGRVVICRFREADLPSDVLGVKVIEAGTVGYDAQKLPEQMLRELRVWLDTLPLLPEGIAPVSQLHGYSGTWRIENNFAVWRGIRISRPDAVYFHGFATLSILPDGRGGKGFQHGSVHVETGAYHARYDVVNEIRNATVDAKGTLALRVVVLSRHLAEETGTPRDERLRGNLPTKEFDVVLEPSTGMPRALHGLHRYTQAMEDYQLAVETYVRVD